MGEAPRLGLPELRALVADAAELEKGVKVFDANGLAHLARHEARIFCEAAGSGSAPYRVQVTFGDDGRAKARCSCMAARSRPFCKHAAALLVAWARSPGAFAVSDAPPPEPAGGGAGKRRAVKSGKVDGRDLMARGVEQAGTLVRELAVAGVASMAEGRTAQIRELAQALREARLRRLSARTLALADLLGARGAAFDAGAYTGLAADMLLTVRKLERHLGGEPLDPRHVEELVGRSWRKEDRSEARGLELVEYAFLARETADGFALRESRFLDLASGAHFAEKQILPAFLAKRTEPKHSRAGTVLRGSGGVYPGYAPVRLDLDGMATSPLDATALGAMAARALPSVGAALAAFQEHRRDVFAPDAFPVAVRAELLLARGPRLLAVDGDGHALHLDGDAELEDRLAAALRSSRLLALLGDVDLAAALPVLRPLAALVEEGGAPALLPLAAGEGAAPAAAASPLEAARRAGASPAALALAEIREELAHLFAAGLSGLVPRATDPVAARLRELGLARPAELLDGAARRPEPAERLDDLVKLYQVLEIALLRLLSSVPVDRSALERVPTWESVHVPRPEAPLDPEELGRRRGRGEVSRYEAAWHLDRYYQELSDEKLTARIFPAWADGSASPFVIRACARRGPAAVEAAARVFRLRAGRVAALTAIQVLRAAGGPAAEQLLSEQREGSKDPVLRVAADEALAALRAAAPLAERRGLAGLVQRLGGKKTRDPEEDRAARLELVAELATRLKVHTLQEDREAAAARLAELGDRSAIPVLRAAFAGDPAWAVRATAARALGSLVDTETVDTLVRLVSARGDDDRVAKVAADALGRMGDARGLSALVAAFADAWKPSIVGDALKQMGAVAVGPLLGLLEERPDLAARKVALDIFAGMPPDDLAAELLERLAGLRPRLAARREEGAFAAAAGLYLKVASAHDACHRQVARAVLEALPEPASKEEKALRRAAERVLAPPKDGKGE